MEDSLLKNSKEASKGPQSLDQSPRVSQTSPFRISYTPPLSTTSTEGTTSARVLHSDSPTSSWPWHSSSSRGPSPVPAKLLHALTSPLEAIANLVSGSGSGGGAKTPSQASSKIGSPVGTPVAGLSRQQSAPPALLVPSITSNVLRQGSSDSSTAYQSSDRTSGGVAGASVGRVRELGTERTPAVLVSVGLDFAKDAAPLEGGRPSSSTTASILSSARSSLDSSTFEFQSLPGPLAGPPTASGSLSSRTPSHVSLNTQELNHTLAELLMRLTNSRYILDQLIRTTKETASGGAGGGGHTAAGPGGGAVPGVSTSAARPPVAPGPAALSLGPKTPGSSSSQLPHAASHPGPLSSPLSPRSQSAHGHHHHHGGTSASVTPPGGPGSGPPHHGHPHHHHHTVSTSGPGPRNLSSALASAGGPTQSGAPPPALKPPLPPKTPPHVQHGPPSATHHGGGHVSRLAATTSGPAMNIPPKPVPPALSVPSTAGSPPFLAGSGLSSAVASSESSPSRPVVISLATPPHASITRGRTMSGRFTITEDEDSSEEKSPQKPLHKGPSATLVPEPPSSPPPAPPAASVPAVPSGSIPSHPPVPPPLVVPAPVVLPISRPASPDAFEGAQHDLSMTLQHGHVAPQAARIVLDPQDRRQIEEAARQVMLQGALEENAWLKQRQELLEGIARRHGLAI